MIGLRRLSIIVVAAIVAVAMTGLVDPLAKRAVEPTEKSCHEVGDGEQTDGAATKSNHQAHEDGCNFGCDLECAIACLCSPLFAKYMIKVLALDELRPGELSVVKFGSKHQARAKGFRHRLFKPPKPSFFPIV